MFGLKFESFKVIIIFSPNTMMMSCLHFWSHWGLTVYHINYLFNFVLPPFNSFGIIRVAAKEIAVRQKLRKSIM